MNGWPLRPVWGPWPRMLRSGLGPQLAAQDFAHRRLGQFVAELDHARHLVLAAELAAQNIRVNLVVPGFVMTEMTAGVSERAREKIVAKVPLRRMGTAEEIADVVWWVAGSSYMTGSTIVTDGGLMCNL